MKTQKGRKINTQVLRNIGGGLCPRFLLSIAVCGGRFALFVPIFAPSLADGVKICRSSQGGACLEVRRTRQACSELSGAGRGRAPKFFHACVLTYRGR